MSRMVANRLRAARRVAQAAHTHADAVGARLDAEFAAVGIAAPPGADIIRAHGHLIQRRADALEIADRAHDEELADDAAPRADRDNAIEAIATRLNEIRDVVGIVADATLQKRLGLTLQPSRLTPDELIQAAKTVADRLRTIALPERRGVRVDAHELADSLDAHSRELDAALAAVDRELREAEATLQTKHQAMSAYDKAFTGAAAALSALFNLADEPELARRVRPSTRRPGQTVLDEAEPSDADGAPAELPPESEPEMLEA